MATQYWQEALEQAEKQDDIHGLARIILTHSPQLVRNNAYSRTGLLPNGRPLRRLVQRAGQALAERLDMAPCEERWAWESLSCHARGGLPARCWGKKQRRETAGVPPVRTPCG
jgi:hypothetical protein